MTCIREKDLEYSDGGIEKGNIMIDKAQLNSECVESWLEEAGRSVLQIITYIEQESACTPQLKINNPILYDILRTAAADISLHFCVDRKTGKLISHMLGPV